MVRIVTAGYAWKVISEKMQKMVELGVELDYYIRVIEKN